MTATFAAPVRLAVEGDAPTFVTITGVEIAHVGMEWPAASGPVTLTFEHLQDAVRAENDDPHILPPRLKLGHTDPRFNEDPPVYDPFAYHGPLRTDGNPVYGKVTNLRLAEDGMVLLGDYVEVPDWLGNALPSAYPSRSLEGDFDIATEGGKRYSFVITAVALLGEPLPAISCLEDLVRELTGGPAAVMEQTPVTLTKEARMPVQAEASIDSVFQQFVSDYAQGDRYWWWPCEIRVDQGWVLADDDEGHFYRVPFTTDADGNVVFDDPQRGVLDFRQVADTEAQEPVAAARGVAFAARPKDRVRPVAATVNQGGRTMDEAQKALAVKLGLGEDATVEQLNEKLQADALAAANRTDDDDAGGDDGAGSGGAGDEEKPPAARGELPVAASIDPAALEQLQRDARLGREAREQQIKADREQFVDKAVAAGKFPPARRGHYLALMSKDEHGTREFIDGLAAGLVPTEERGAAPAQDAAAANDLDWFPQFQTTKETVNG